MSSTLRYLSGAVCSPLAWRAGIIAGGLGIERRMREYRRLWEPHIERSKSVQRLWLERLGPNPGRRIAIIGAGRLFDVALPEIAARFPEVVLVDADPNCRGGWRQARRAAPQQAQIDGRIVDITGVLATWRRELREVLADSGSVDARWQVALDCIRSRGAAITSGESDSSPTTFLGPNVDAIISINVLSQLPLGWQTIAEAELRRVFGAAHVAAHEQEWLEAYIASGRRIVEAHLQSLADTPARSLLLLTDLRYAFFRRSEVGSAPTVEWESDPRSEPSTEPWGGKWVSSTVERLEEMDALLGARVEGTGLVERFHAHSIEYYRPWTWPLTPARGTEKGESHAVAAFGFTRS